MFHRCSYVIAQNSAIRSSWSPWLNQQKHGIRLFRSQVFKQGGSVHSCRQLVNRQRRAQFERKNSGIPAMDKALHDLEIIIPENGKPYVRLMEVNEVERMLEIQPSYPQKPKAVQNLVNGLSEILSDPGHENSNTLDFGTKSWYLDKSGRAIHRHFALRLEDQVENFKNNVKEAADEINHHPHITAAGRQLTITCATHNPPGLSVKDVKLAKRIDEIVKADSGTLLEIENLGQTRESIISDRTHAANKNMLAVTQAQDECGCGH